VVKSPPRCESLEQRAPMTEATMHSLIAAGVMAVGVIVFVSLFFVNAPYGRHVRAGWGPTVPSRLGWMVMESPALLGFAAVYAVGRNAGQPAPSALCALWLVHYTNRAIIFPRRLRDAQKPMPLSVVALAIVFNLINAYLNARAVSQLGAYPKAWLVDPRFVVGVVLFAAGMAVNVSSDNILLALRRPGEAGYRIPQGGLFRWVSMPSYLGELVEWAGWAVATWSLAGLSFLVFTFANLVPRAVANHRWYQGTFGDAYPQGRRAVFPFLW
jgi:protein-S-isoprenylcysteine O-methyltransferase Ste14